MEILSDKVTPTSFLLTWCPPLVEATNNSITAYILEYGESDTSASPPHTIPLSGVAEEHTVTGLKPHTEYYVKVAAENTAGRGPFCEPVLVQTAPDSESCRVHGPHSPHRMNHIVVCGNGVVYPCSTSNGICSGLVQCSHRSCGYVELHN